MAVTATHEADTLNFTVQTLGTSLCQQSWHLYVRFSFKLAHFIVQRHSMISLKLDISPVCILFL